MPIQPATATNAPVKNEATTPRTISRKPSIVKRSSMASEIAEALNLDEIGCREPVRFDSQAVVEQRPEGGRDRDEEQQRHGVTNDGFQEPVAGEFFGPRRKRNGRREKRQQRDRQPE